MRKPLLAGNWKMNINHYEAISHIQKFSYMLPSRYYSHIDVAFLVPFTDIRSVETYIDSEKQPLSFGAQDVSPHVSGAYTGQISASFLQTLHCSYCIVGHSERRQELKETNTQIAQKVSRCLENDIIPILCVGESEAIRNDNQHFPFCAQQLIESLSQIPVSDVTRVVIAYEPIWAIGTGKIATTVEAQKMCSHLRQTVGSLGSASDEVRILYGGSVSDKNIGSLIREPDIDGALVGGASLDPEIFAKLCASAASVASGSAPN